MRLQPRRKTPQCACVSLNERSRDAATVRPIMIESAPRPEGGGPFHCLRRCSIMKALTFQGPQDALEESWTYRTDWDCGSGPSVRPFEADGSQTGGEGILHEC